MDLRSALIDWDDANDENGNTVHVGEHGLSPEEVESVIYNEATEFDVSHSSGRPIAFGTADTGRFIAVVFEILNLDSPLIVRPITAYDVPEKRE